MNINRIHETQNLVAVACFLPGWAKDLSAPLYNEMGARRLQNELKKLITVNLSHTLVAGLLARSQQSHSTLQDRSSCLA